MESYIEIFNNYYSNFDDSIPAIRRKYDHTFRVVNYAEQIARSLNLSDEDIITAKLCALFHDIARFKQYTIYHTYEDSESFDHGDVGCDVLKELDINNNIIILSTKYHNKYDVSNELNDKEKLFANITRDADKIDIMMTQAQICNDSECIIPEDVLISFKNYKLLKNDVMDPKLDIFNMLRCLAFIFDINYQESLKIINKSNVINLKCDEILSKFDDNKVKEIKNICNKYINERISE